MNNNDDFDTINNMNLMGNLDSNDFELPPDMPQAAPIQMITETFSQIIVKNDNNDD